MRYLVLIALALLGLLWHQKATAQMAWTYIYVDGNSKVDLWTQEATGCSCPWDTTSRECACCVKDGGCHCGQSVVNRCTQCGLEHHCSHMCNITIDSSSLRIHSGKTFGQIKSPAVEGPGFCWYTFMPNATQRVEVQIYRLVSIGKFNGTRCEGGLVQLVPGRDPKPRLTDLQICGPNERFAPPVVMFADSGPATLLFQIKEKTSRSQFLAYFSFTSINNTQGLGYQPKGGTRLPNTECDWSYQEASCRRRGSCVLSSPGYPGVYPPNRKCNYHISAASANAKIKLTFTFLNLSQRCETDYIAVYRDQMPKEPRLATLCSNKKQEMVFSGPSLLIQFSSGNQMPPYDYNGFLANLEISEKSASTEDPNELGGDETRTEISSVLRPSASAGDEESTGNGCDLTVSGNNSRSGHFDTRTKDWQPVCKLIFKGRPTDVVHVSLFNYRLRSSNCRSSIEVLDGMPGDGKQPVHKLCSPHTKHARDSNGHFLEQQNFVSSGNAISIILKRPASPPSAKDSEFVDGAFLFHDEQISGTVQPGSVCDVQYHGLNSPSAGMVDTPGGQHLYWNVEGPLRCSQQFVPAQDQSVTITIRAVGRMAPDPYCQTQCGDGGCRCVPADQVALTQTDHLLLISEHGQFVSCICGDFQPESLPVSVRSWSPLTVVYSVAHYTWAVKGYSFSASYSFVTDQICGHHSYTLHSGEISSKNINLQGDLNEFYHQSCTWALDSNVERQLFIEVSSEQNRPCTAWNLTIHEHTSGGSDSRPLGELLHTFCPRDGHRTFSLPWRLNTVLIRLRALTRIPPEFIVKWRSQVVRANTRLGNPTPAPNAISRSPQSHPVCLQVAALALAALLVRL